MILADWQIQKAINDGEIIVTPFDSSLINPSSLDVRLGKMFSWTEPVPITGVIDPLNSSSFRTKTMEKDHHILGPGQAVLGVLLEDITLPDTISVEIKGKSSIGRLFLSNSHWAGWIDPGWSGFLTVELRNDSGFPIRLTPGMKIGQLIFYKHKKVTNPYSVSGRYYKQPPGSGSKGV